MKIRRIEAGLLVMGLGFLAISWAVRIHRIAVSHKAITRFKAKDVRTINKVPALSSDFRTEPVVDIRLWSAQRIKAYHAGLAKKSEVPLAILHIPKINLEVPVFNGTDELTLERGAGRIPGTAQIGQVGNVGIAGHRDSFFRRLKDIKLGDAVEINRPEQVDEYVVSQIQIVRPDDVYVLDPTPTPSVTLVTCFPFYYMGSAPKRYVVTASMSNSQMNSSGGAFLMARSGAPQVKTDTAVTEEELTKQVNVERGEIVSIQGHNVVMKMEDGTLRDFHNLPESVTFTVDGKPVNIENARAGMKLEKQTVATTPRVITTVETVSGKVWQVQPPDWVTLTLEDGTNQRFNIPRGQKFTVNGRETDAFGLKKGMRINAQRVTEIPETVITQQEKRAWKIPPPPSMPVAPKVPIVIAVPPTLPASAVPAPPVETAPAEAAPKTLPKTGSGRPLIGLLGMVLCSLALTTISLWVRTTGKTYAKAATSGAAQKKPATSAGN